MNKADFFNNIKTYLIIAGFCFTFHSILAQSSNTEYFMSSSFSKPEINPAKRPEKGYIGIPGLTNFVIDYKTNTFNLDHFIFPGVGENGKSGLFLHENVSHDDFMKNISPANYLGANIDWTLIGFGFYVKDFFLSFDITERVSTTLNVPGDLFDFAKKGVATDADGTEYNISNLRVNAQAFTQVGLGASYPLLNKSLVLGAKFKILLGNAYADLKLDDMHININNDSWRASTQASGNMLIPTVQPVPVDNKLDHFDTDGSFSPINGSGFGFDLGATFKPGKLFDFDGSLEWLNPFTVSAAITDVGFISWNKNKMSSYYTDPAEIDITGNRTIHVDGSDEEIFKDLGDKLNDAVAFHPASPANISSGLGAKFNWGIEYALMHDKMNVGLLNTVHFNPVKTISEFTVAGAYRPMGGIELGLSYSFIHSSFQTFGFALHLGPGFYIASDYVIPHVNSSFIPTTSKALNVQFGAVVPIGKKHK